MPRRHVRSALVATTCLVVACRGTDGGDATLSGARKAEPEHVAAAAMVADSAVTVGVALTAAAPAAPRTDAASAIAPTDAMPDAAGTMLVRSGTARLEVDSLEPALDALRRGAATIGATVGTSTLSGGRETVRSATLELRIPAARWDDAVATLRPLGTIESIETHVADVGEEYVDLGARLANARRLEERLVTLLATRTGKLDDVLAVERELARVREEIERHEGRMRWLRTRAATSTLAITLHEPLPLVGTSPQTSLLGDAVTDAWRLLVRTVAAGITALGVVVPVGALVALGAVVVRRWRRRAALAPA